MSTTPAVREQSVGVVLSLVTRLSPRQSLAAGVITLAATVAAYVYMANKGMNTEGLLILALPIISTLFSQAGLSHVTGQQDAVLAAQPSSDDVESIVTEVIRREVPAIVSAAIHAYAEATEPTLGVPAPRAELVS